MPLTLVNTESIASSADTLRSINSNINSECNKMKNNVERIDSNWRSPAGDAAQVAIHHILKQNDERSTVIQNYINILEQLINPGYSDTETANATLADKFK